MLPGLKGLAAGRGHHLEATAPTDPQGPFGGYLATVRMGPADGLLTGPARSTRAGLGRIFLAAAVDPHTRHEGRPVRLHLYDFFPRIGRISRLDRWPRSDEQRGNQRSDQPTSGQYS
jgi:hypothetical protein